MKRQVVALLGFILMAPILLATAGTRMLLIAHDLEDHPLSGFHFSYEGVESQATNQAGSTELNLPPGPSPGQQIKIFLVHHSKQTEDWFLVNPQVNIPGGSDSAEMVLMRRSAFRQVAAEARDAPGAKVRRSNKQSTTEDPKQVLVAAAARRGLTSEQLESAIQSFAETQDPKDRGISAYLEGRYQKAEELLNGAVEKKESDLVETLRYLGATQYQQAKYRAAADSFRKALVLRSEDSDLLIWLGESLRASADWVEAEPLLRRALDINERSYGPESPEVATALNDLALLLKATNRLAEAEPLLRRALAIDEKSYGSEHPEVATTLDNLACLLRATNRLAEAEPLMRRALAIEEKSYGTNHPEVAITLDNLAVLLKATNRLAEAEPLMRRALAIEEKSYGIDHPEVAITLNNLAQLLKATNRLVEAEPLMRRALAIDEKSFGTDHPNVARDINILAPLLQATNRLVEAEPLMRRALAIDEKSFGTDHPNVAGDLNILALLIRCENHLAEAESMMRRALAIEERSYGTDHPDVASTLDNLAELLEETNRLAEAESLMRRALAIDEKSYGTNHPEVAITLDNLALLLKHTNRLTEAEPLMRRGLTILIDFSRSTGYEHPKQEAALANYRGLLQAMGKSPAQIEESIKTLK